ncbi:uncharacterized protein [Apostichopus japonicus]|uniref:uncharacterized protein n=1 Tax=Stichopus japonicus TaxID=307972 RepID=UPI003AB23BDC
MGTATMNKNASNAAREDDQLIIQESDDPDHHGEGYGVCIATVFNIAAIAGTGILVLPNALANTGWSGLAVLVTLAIIQLYTGIILGRCWSLLQERFEIYRQQTRYPYAAIGYEAFGKIGRIIVTVTINTTLLCICVVLLLIISENVMILLNIHDLNHCIMMAIIVILLCPFSWLGTPKDFWQVAVCGAVTTGLSCLLLLVSIARNIPHADVAKLSYRAPSFASYFSGVGIMVMAFNGHPTFLTIQHDMRNPEQYPHSLLLTALVVGLYFLPLSTVAYYTHGRSLADKENIFQIVVEGVDRTISLALITLHVISAFIIYGNPLFQEIEELIGIPLHFSWKRLGIRTLLMAFIWFLAASVNSFANLISLMGGTTLIALALVYPICFYWRLRHTKSTTNLWEPQYLSIMEKIFFTSILILAVFIAISTTYANLSSYGKGLQLNFTRPCYLPEF